MKEIKLEDLNEQEFLNLYNQGYTDTDIAFLLNNRRNNVAKLRNKLNLEANFLKREYINNKAEILKLIEKGMTDADIARTLNLDGRTIGTFRKYFKINANWVKRTYKNKTDRLKGYMLRNIKFSAFSRNLDFNLDYSDLVLPKYCPILNVELKYSKSPNDPFGASVDRIDNNRGYVKDNIIIMSRKANAMKSNCDFDQLLLFCSNMNNLIAYYKIRGALGDITDIFPDTEYHEET